MKSLIFQLKQITKQIDAQIEELERLAASEPKLQRDRIPLSPRYQGLHGYVGTMVPGVLSNPILNAIKNRWPGYLIIDEGKYYLDHKICTHTCREILRLKGVGRKLLMELCLLLEKHGLNLACECPHTIMYQGGAT
jgi:hypothetical protein